MIKKITMTAITIILIAFMIYFVASWIDVLNNNIGNGSHFHSWNIFQIALGKFLN